jgi:hypothetical protein
MAISIHIAHRSLSLLFLLSLGVPSSSAGYLSAHLLAMRSHIGHQQMTYKQGAMLHRIRGGGSGDLLKCRFEVQVQHTRPGDTVVLVGGGEALRNWDKGSPIELTTTKEEFPWWSAHVELPVGEKLAFKFAIRSKSGTWVWEPLAPGMNRDAVINRPEGSCNEGMVLSYAYGDTNLPISRANSFVNPVEPWFEEEPQAEKAEPKPADNAPSRCQELLGLLSPRKTTRSASPQKRMSETSPQKEKASQQEEHDVKVEKESCEEQAVAFKKATELPKASDRLAPVPVAAPAPSDDTLEDTTITPNTSSKLQRPELQMDKPSGKVSKTPLFKNFAEILVRAALFPVSIPLWTVYTTIKTTLAIVSRIFLTISSIFFEIDPNKFERSLIKNMAQMQGSMRAMNSSLSTAADTVEKQMGDVRHLEGLWELEHQRYQVALEQRKSAETKFEKATREFREEVAAMKKELDDAEKAHAEQLRSSRAEVQGMLVEAQNTFEAGLASLESALAVSKCDVSRLERELQEARADSSKSILEECEITMKAVNITSSDLHEDMDVMKQAAAEAEKAHAEQVRSARTELQRVLSDTQENFKREVNRLEAALKVGNGDVERLELELHEARDMLKEATLEITRFGKELTDSRAEAALFQQKLASSEAALAQHKMQIESLMTGRLIKFQVDSGITSERTLESAAPTKGVAAKSQGPFKLKVTVVKSLQYLHAQKSTLSKMK